MTILLDPAHGGTDLGYVNINTGQTEAQTNWNVALDLKNMLEEAGYSVIMTRSGPNETVSLEQRMALIKSKKPDLVISIQHNSSPNAMLAGAEIYAQVADANGGPSRTLARMIGQEFIDVDQTLRSIIFEKDAQGKDYYGILRAASEAGIPAVITKYAYMDNVLDITQIDTPEEQQQEAQAIFDAITQYISQISQK